MPLHLIAMNSLPKILEGIRQGTLSNLLSMPMGAFNLLVMLSKFGGTYNMIWYVYSGDEGRGELIENTQESPNRWLCLVFNLKCHYGTNYERRKVQCCEMRGGSHTSYCTSTTTQITLE